MTELTMDKQAHAVLSADVITERLREMILTGLVGVGVQLKQEALAKHFGVSRIPVREALKRLEVEGLVHHVAHQGSIVARRSIQDLLEILDIRIGLETRAIELAVPNMTPDTCRPLEQILERYSRSDLPLEWSELNYQFHMGLYRPCNRPRLLKLIDDTFRACDIHLRVHQSYTVGRKSPQDEHWKLLEACEVGDALTAKQLLAQHIEHTQVALHKIDQETTSEDSLIF